MSTIGPESFIDWDKAAGEFRAHSPLAAAIRKLNEAEGRPQDAPACPSCGQRGGPYCDPQPPDDHRA